MTALFDEYEMRWTFAEPILGTIPKHRDVWSDHVRHQLAGDDETEAAENLADAADTAEKGWTGFYTDNEGRPILFDYQIKGALKEAANTIKDVLGLKALRAKVDSDVFITPRVTVLADDVDGYLERPLRAMTMQGPRVSVVRSDKVDPGREYVVRLRVLKKSRVTLPVLEALGEYLTLKGFGQWRNGGYGRAEKVTFTLVS